MTIAEEEDIIHKTLALMLANLGRPNYLPDMLTQMGAANDRYVEPILTRLVSDGLANQANKEHGVYMLQPSTKAIDMARHPDGYKGFVADKVREQQAAKKAQAKKEALDRDAALATVSAAKSSKSSASAAWVAAFASVISIGISIFALVQSSQIAEVEAKLRTLQKQILSASKPVLPPERIKFRNK